MMSCLEWSSMRAVDMIDILHLPDYTTAAISSAISFLTKGWVEVQSDEAAGLRRCSRCCKWAPGRRGGGRRRRGAGWR